MMRIEGARLSLSGPVTLATVASMVEEGGRQVTANDTVLDLSGVTQVDSAALALLLGWTRAARAAGRQIRFQGAPAALVSLASLYDVDTLLPLAS
ncbi:STAS domain-containing protein [Zoogloea sp.]|uniref:STAS domain-containing protein n=1 Tax=Zoogloea sp. TaxID=49181 RepID=UPI00262768D6|nr:STAS domain-containing protein [Zoogloea sp.]MDD3354288.1 STAS domain-containing protein [Zoogloea sp.]